MRRNPDRRGDGTGGEPGRINVGFDNFKAGFDMTTMLLASGKRHIIYFGSMSDVRDEQRYAGYCQAMENAGLPTGRIAPIRCRRCRLAPA